jgi:hypothetical protein
MNAEPTPKAQQNPERKWQKFCLRFPELETLCSSPGVELFAASQ